MKGGVEVSDETDSPKGNAKETSDEYGPDDITEK